MGYYPLNLGKQISPKGNLPLESLSEDHCDTVRFSTIDQTYQTLVITCPLNPFTCRSACVSNAQHYHVAAAGALLCAVSPVLCAARFALAFDLRCDLLSEQRASSIHCAPRSEGWQQKQSHWRGRLAKYWVTIPVTPTNKPTNSRNFVQSQ